MKVTLSHITAAYFWLMTTMDGRDLDRLQRCSSLGNCPTRIRDLSFFDLQRYEIDNVKTDILSTDSSCQPARNDFAYHFSSRVFPACSFVMLDVGMQLVSPELSFWQMGKILPLGELIKFGDALTGKYSYTLDANGRMVKRHMSLTTVKRLSDFIAKMGTRKCNPNAFKAIKYIVEGSESPMESDVTILLCLKRLYGGFALPKPIMGYVVRLDEIGKRLAECSECRCDMYWPDANYDLEYDSNQEHGPEAASHDSMRRSAIRHRGITVGELRWPQVSDAETFEISARLIAKDIGHRIVKRSPELEFKYSLAYQDLRRQLFWWERMECCEAASPLRIGDLDW